MTHPPAHSPPVQSARIDGIGVASDYARRLLLDLGLRVVAGDGARDPHPALAWAACGAMALTGRPDAAPRVPSGAIASSAAGVGRALAALGAKPPTDAAALLGERAALHGLTRRGRIAPGGHCRLLRAADGWAALNLARDEDVRALPAWLETAPCPSDDDDAWAFAARAVRERPLAALTQRARWLGLPFAPANAAGTGASWLRVTPCGPRSAPPVRAPRVVDLSSLWAGPLCGALLADAGARVVKVESLARPDGARAGAAAFFALLHTGKRNAQLDFAADRDRALLRALLDSADLVIDSARPRALAQLGVVAEEFVAARPGRVWVGITGYGRADPAPGRVAFGDDAGVDAGLAHAVADPDGPLFCGDAIADPLTGLHAALAAWASWRSGGGVLLDLSLRDVAAHALSFQATGSFEVRGGAESASVIADGARAPVRAPRARSARGVARAAGADTEACRRALRAAC